MPLPRPRRGLLTFLIFLVLSGLFWLSTSLNGYYDYEVELPVELCDVPTHLVLTSEEVPVVRVTVHDKGFVLLQYLRRSKITAVQVPFATYSTQANRLVVSSAELHKLIAKKLVNSTSIVSVKPEKIDMTYIEGFAKRVPVQLIGNLTPAKDYYLEHTELSPSQVTVYASRSDIDAISAVDTELCEMTDFCDTVRSTVRLVAPENTKVVPATVEVTLFPDVLTEQEVTVPITATALPDGIILRTFPSEVVVHYTVGAAMFRTIDVAAFKVEVDYDELLPEAEKCCIALTELPPGVKTATLDINEVDYLLENR